MDRKGASFSNRNSMDSRVKSLFHLQHLSVRLISAWSGDASEPWNQWNTLGGLSVRFRSFYSFEHGGSKIQRSHSGPRWPNFLNPKYLRRVPLTYSNRSSVCLALPHLSQSVTQFFYANRAPQSIALTGVPNKIQHAAERPTSEYGNILQSDPPLNSVAPSDSHRFNSKESTAASEEGEVTSESDMNSQKSTAVTSGRRKLRIGFKGSGGGSGGTPPYYWNNSPEQGVRNRQIAARPSAAKNAAKQLFRSPVKPALIFCLLLSLMAHRMWTKDQGIRMLLACVLLIPWTWLNLNFKPACPPPP